MTMSKMAAEIRNNLVSLINQYNDALKAKDLDAMTKLEGDIRDTEAAFANQSQDDLFSICKNAESPILEGVKRYEYQVLKHRLNRDGDIITSMDLVEDRTKQIDLVKLCKFCNLDYLWAYTVEKAGELLCIRTAKEIGMSTDEIKQISKTYRMQKKAMEVELGGTPTSNTQICRLLQKVIDEILFVDDGTGKNVYKCNSHDVAYLLMCYTKRGRKQLSVTVAKSSFLHGLIVDVMHRIVCGLKYGLEYAMIRESDAKPEASDTPKAEPKKATAPELNEDDAPETVDEDPETIVIPREEESADIA